MRFIWVITGSLALWCATTYVVASILWDIITKGKP